MTWVPEQWYVVAWDGEIDQRPMSRMICGEQVLLYRRLDGGIVAMRDACPHRLLPLSMGLKEGDSIRCRYHGLLVDGTGAVVEMPVKTDRVPSRLCLKTYPVVERHRFVWLWVGDPAKADPALVPDLWPCSRRDWAFDGGYYRIKCDYRLVIDNLMDLTHETHVHAGSIGQMELLETPISTRVEGNQVFITRWMPNVDAPPFWRTFLGKTGAVDRWQVCQFIPPSSVIIDVGVAPVEAGSTVEHHDGGVRGFVIDALTPETETSTHYFWGMARNFAVDDPGVGTRLRRQQGMVFQEDVEVLEAQQQAIEANRDMKLNAFGIDAGGVRARRIIEEMAKAAGG